LNVGWLELEVMVIGASVAAEVSCERIFSSAKFRRTFFRQQSKVKIGK
jgi:hypothetical protein